MFDRGCPPRGKQTLWSGRADTLVWEGAGGICPQRRNGLGVGKGQDERPGLRLSRRFPKVPLSGNLPRFTGKDVTFVGTSVQAWTTIAFSPPLVAHVEFKFRQ